MVKYKEKQNKLKVRVKSCEVQESYNGVSNILVNKCGLINEGLLPSAQKDSDDASSLLYLVSQ